MLPVQSIKIVELSAIVVNVDTTTEKCCSHFKKITFRSLKNLNNLFCKQWTYYCRLLYLYCIISTRIVLANEWFPYEMCVCLLKMLLDHHANINETFASLQTTALMTSSFHGHEKIVRLLLSRGANPRAVDQQGSTALGYAFGGNYSERVKILDLCKSES